MAESGRRSLPAAGSALSDRGLPDRRRFLRAVTGLAGAWVTGAAAASAAPVLLHRVSGAHPHDPAAFTQGLLYHDGALYESTGLRGQSSLRRVDPASGEVLARRTLPDWAFGEGLALVGEELVQLTWRAGVAFRWRRSDLAPVGQHRYEGEGWGLASDGMRLLMSDGSARLTWRDALTFETLDTLEVRDGARPVTRLNELEFAAGALYANVWQERRIARIDPGDGRVTGWIDLSALPGPMFASRSIDVLNGIAWDAPGGRLLVTGKLWPRLFEVQVEGLNLAM